MTAIVQLRMLYIILWIFILYNNISCVTIEKIVPVRPNGTWLSMGIMGPWLSLGEERATPEMCASANGLTSKQQKLCNFYPEHMIRVGHGAKQAIKECQYQFRDRRWNCSITDPNTVFGPALNIASRENAFIHALSAAGVAVQISRACRDGRLAACGCSRATRPRDLQKEWVWGGCGDNLEYGYKFAKEFIDGEKLPSGIRKGSREHGRILMHLHNNEAGRRAMVHKSRVTCKCHGVSGSCSLITCWQQLAPFREIGDYLKSKYDRATEVRIGRRGRLQIRDDRYNMRTSNDLVYLEDSPNYCVNNPKTGSLGTQGRICNRTSSGLDGCRLLCCGRGYNTKKISVPERCECKFHWCCYVECKKCVKNIDLHTCK